MRTFYILLCAAVAHAKPQESATFGVADGRIVGGEEAPPRKNYIFRILLY